MGTELRWAVMGAGRIAHAVLPMLAAARGCRVVCVASSDLGRAASLARVGGLDDDASRGACDYETLTARDDVDAVYVTLMNHQHFEWSKRLLESGKHVLCEKPLVPTASEAEILADVATKFHRLCGEGYMYMHHPQTARLVELARHSHDPGSPIGPIRAIRSVRDVTNNDSYILNTRLSHAMRGGAVMDIGCYPISLARLVAGEEPIPGSIRANAQFAALRPGEGGAVDETCRFSWEFPSGARFESGCSFARPHSVFFELVGERGRAFTDYPFSPDAMRQPLIIERDGVTSEEVFEGAGDRFTLQFERFARAALGECEPLPTMEWSIGQARTIEAIHRAIGLRWT